MRTLVKKISNLFSLFAKTTQTIVFSTAMLQHLCKAGLCCVVLLDLSCVTNCFNVLQRCGHFSWNILFLKWPCIGADSVCLHSTVFCCIYSQCYDVTRTF